MFIIVDEADEYVYLCDGKTRKIEKPKKKKKKHIQIINEIDYNINHRLENGEPVSDADVRKALAKKDVNGLKADTECIGG
jgi:ribosomal protein L14E/L6E/L27E